MRRRVIDLAKELGVPSKDLIVVLEGMGHQGMRARRKLLLHCKLNYEMIELGGRLTGIKYLRGAI